MHTPLETVLPSDVLPDLIKAVGEAARTGQTFHDLDIRTKGHLALFGYFTTDPQNARDPGSMWGYHSHQLQEGMLNRLAANTDKAMENVPSFEKARKDNTLGLSMATVLTGMRTVRYHGVHIAEPRHKTDKATGKTRVVNGVVASHLATYSLPNNEVLSTAAHEMFQGLYGKHPLENISTPLEPSPDWEDPLNPWSQAWVPSKKTYLPSGALVETDARPPSSKPRTIQVTQLNEYERIVNEAQSRLIRQELAKIGVVLPKEKVPLVDWLQRETMPKEIQDWLEAIDATYDKMHTSGLVEADYVDDPGGTRLMRARRDHIVAADPSAISKVKRDQLNRLGHVLEGRGGDGRNNPGFDIQTAATEKHRGDSRYNQEQHPNPRRRYFIERGVYLKRPRPTPGVPYYAPAASQPLNVFERALVSVQETWREVKTAPRSHIIRALPDIVAKVFGGTSDILVSGSVIVAKGALAAGKGLMNYAKNIKGWKEQKKLAYSRLDTILAELRQKQVFIQGGAIPDAFPDISMKPSEQLELIKAMTVMMRANLAYQAPDSNDEITLA